MAKAWLHGGVEVEARRAEAYFPRIIPAPSGGSSPGACARHAGTRRARVMSVSGITALPPASRQSLTRCWGFRVGGPIAAHSAAHKGGCRNIPECVWKAEKVIETIPRAIMDLALAASQGQESQDASKVSEIVRFCLFEASMKLLEFLSAPIAAAPLDGAGSRV
jgi:hypothetical protein